MTVTPAAPPSADGLTPEQVDLQQRARRFVDEVLIPNEELAERSGGHLSEELIQRIKREAIAAGLSGGLHAPEHGGQGWSKTEWFLVEEQLGRSTNALSWYMPGAYNVLASGTPEQIEGWLAPALLPTRLADLGFTRRSAIAVSVLSAAFSSRRLRARMVASSP